MNGNARPGERGVSEVIGTVLLISLVLLGSATVIVLGAGAISDAQERTRTQSAADHLQELDARLATLSADADRPQAEFDPRDSLAGDLRLSHDGYLNVTVDRRGACSVQQPLSTITYEDSQGRTVGYEAGGVWRAGADGSASVTPPDVTFRNGRLVVELVNLTGHVDRATNVVDLNVSATRNRSREATAALRQGACVRPDNLTIRVNSRFSAAWRDYLAAETGVPAGNVDSFPNGTVRVVVPQAYLHPSVDDARNNVVNLGGAPYMADVTLTDGRPAAVGVDKGAGNVYSAFVEPLTNESLDIGRQISVEGANVPGPPLDVSIVLDESGSMGDDADPACTGSCQSKSEAAKEAAQSFAGYINESRDRIAILGYDDEGYYHRVDGQYFSGDFDAVNATVENDVGANGGTQINEGLNYSNAAFDLRSDETRSKYAILLTDGKNDDCDLDPGDSIYDCPDNVQTLEAAWVADNSSITVYTIGFGGNVEDELLSDVAQATGGTYYPAADADDLEAAFENISQRIQPEDAIASTPMTSNVSATSGQVFAPEIPGETGHIADVAAGGETLLNINDPTAPALFSHSFVLADGDEAMFNVTSYECAEDAWNLTGQVRTINGTAYSVARCTDIASTNGSFAAEVSVDGERPASLLSTDYASWQTNVNESLAAFPDVTIDPATGTLEAKSNQALVVYDLPPQGPGTRNTLALLVQVGLSESEASGAGIVSVRVAEAELS